MRVLPAGGWDGPIPEWPLIEDLGLTTDRETRLSKIADLEFLAEDDELAPAKRARLDQKIAAERRAVALIEEKIGRQKDLEVSLWEKLWRSPQAAAWQQLGWTRDVATYARLSVLAEMGDLKLLQEARMWSDRLGLTPKAMRALLWVVSDDEVGAKRQQKSGQAGAASAGRRLAAVDPAG
ncbi:hypothetical protein [Micropruina sp.]|uniref:hypothetical protein n=1 Tax=Micropruina sp. TaxID=2737536 RepID=UPI0039E2956E